MRRHLPLLWALSLVLLALAWFAHGTLLSTAQQPRKAITREPAASTERDEPFAVRVMRVSLEPYRPVLELSAHAEPFRRLLVRTRAAGEVKETPREEGAPVRAGDILCRLDDTGERERLAAAKAALASAERDARAARRLFARGTLPEAQLKKAEAALARARAAVKQARLALEWRIIRAPMSGMLQRQLAKVGDVVSPGAPCAELVRLDRLKVSAQATETEVARLKPGMAVSARFANDMKLSGRLAYVAPAGSAATRTFRVEAELANPGKRVRGGMTARLRIPLPERRVARLPLSALVLADDGRLGVHVARADNTVAFVPLSIVEERREGVLVSGLASGTRVIVVGHYFVVPGQKVRPLPTTAGNASQSGSEERR